VQLVSKISNLCDHKSQTLQTDDMRSQDRALHYSASHGKSTNRPKEDIVHNKMGLGVGDGLGEGDGLGGRGLGDGNG